MARKPPASISEQRQHGGGGPLQLCQRDSRAFSSQPGKCTCMSVYNFECMYVDLLYMHVCTYVYQVTYTRFTDNNRIREPSETHPDKLVVFCMFPYPVCMYVHMHIYTNTVITHASSTHPDELLVFCALITHLGHVKFFALLLEHFVAYLRDVCMYVYVCMYVCMYVCVYVCLSVCVYVARILAALFVNSMDVEHHARVLKVHHKVCCFYFYAHKQKKRRYCVCRNNVHEMSYLCMPNTSEPKFNSSHVKLYSSYHR